MPRHDIIVIGASSGGLEALRILVGSLPRDLPAALFVVWHIAPESPGLLPDILERAGALPALHPDDGEAIKLGRIYVAPPDRHLVLEQGHVRLSRGPKENRFRPALDPLFRSAAVAYGPRVIGVVLSGGLDDGTAGMEAITARGGITVIQDPRDALEPGMPTSVLAHVAVDHIAPVAGIGPLLADLVLQPAMEGELAMPKQLEIETQIALEHNPLAAGVMGLGKLSPYTCPECHGTLLQIDSQGIVRFRCHAGHAFSVDSLLTEIKVSIEETLWSAIRAIEERMLLLRDMARHLSEHEDGAAVDDLLRQAREVEQQSQLVRLAILRHEQRVKIPVAANDEHTPV